MPFGDTDLIAVVREVVRGSRALDSAVGDHPDFDAFLRARAAAVNLANDAGDTPLHVAGAPTPGGSGYPGRPALIRALLCAGANPFLLNGAGATPLEVAVDEAEREELVRLVFEHRMAEEQRVPSIAPLTASRLMKRARNEDRGSCVFSAVLPHCAYYLYKGAVYLWDTEADVEHVVYQPRDEVARIADAEQRLSSFYRRRSFVAHGGEDPAFDVTDEEQLLASLRALEAQAPLVRHFTVAVGLRAAADVLPRGGGALEWLLCDTGALVAVRLGRHGIQLCEGGGPPGGGRRKSHVCGASASYPAGKRPNVRVRQHCCVRFARRPTAGELCCAIDGVRGAVGYVVASHTTSPVPTTAAVGGAGAGAGGGEGAGLTRGGVSSAGAAASTSAMGMMGAFAAFASTASESPSPSSRASTPAPSLKPEESGAATPTAASPAAASLGARRALGARRGSDGISGSHRAVHFATDNDEQQQQQQQQQQHAAFCGPDEIVFRLVQFAHMTPKIGFDECMAALCDRWEPFRGTRVSEFRLKAPVPELEDGASASAIAAAAAATQQNSRIEPVCVQLCGSDLYLVFLTTGVVVIDAAVDPPVRRELRTQPVGPVVDGVGMHPQRFRTLRAAAPELHFAQVSRVVELFQVCTTPPRGGDTSVQRELAAVLRIPIDRVSPHRYTPLFHPAADAMVVLYQSPRRQELCVYQFSTRAMHSVCRLPKPSSLRFYSNPAADGGGSSSNGAASPALSSLPQLSFAFSVDGSRLMRYNVSMCVMSIYTWSEVYGLLSSAASSGGAAAAVGAAPPPPPRRLITSTFTRAPVEVERGAHRGRSGAHSKLVGAAADEEEPEESRGRPCVWLICESAALEALQREMWGGGGGGGSNGMAMATLLPQPLLAPDELRAKFRIARELHEQIAATVRRVVMAHGGRLCPFPTAPGAAAAAAVGEGCDGEWEPQTPEEHLRAECPLMPTRWCATFFVQLEAARAAIMLTRALLSAPWSAAVLALPQFAPIRLEYKPKSALERRFRDAATVDDPDAGPFLRRGAEVAAFVCPGTTRSDAALMLAVLARSVRDAAPAAVAAASAKRAAARVGDGLVIVDAALMKELRPLVHFFAASAVVAVPAGPTAVLVVPGELEQRVKW